MNLGADIDIKDSDGLTALLHAAHNGHEAAAYWLQEITIMGILSTSTNPSLHNCVKYKFGKLAGP